MIKKNQFREMIINDNIQLFLNEITGEINDNDDLEHEIIILQNRYISLTKDYNKGTIGFDDYSLNKTKIIDTCLKVLEKIPLNEFDHKIIPNRKIKLPKLPYKGLESFKKEDEHIFFGRDEEIIELLQFLQVEHTQLILLYGQSGIGKSSFLNAGLLPKLNNNQYFIHNFYIQHIFFDNASFPLDKSIYIFDQAENVILSDEKENRVSSFVLKVKEILSLNPDNKVILTFRKEFLAEFSEAFDNYEIDFSYFFLKPLSEWGVREAIQGVCNKPFLRQKYGLSITEEVANLIYHEVERDDYSHKAPLLQIILKKMWDSAIQKSKSKPIFDVELFKSLKISGLYSAVENQLNSLKIKLPLEFESGLIYDVVRFFVSDFGTSISRRDAEIREKYSHIKNINHIKESLINSYILTTSPGQDNNEVPVTRLSHDSLGMIILNIFNNSEKVSQRAYRLLELTHKNHKDIEHIFLNEYNLEILIKAEGSLRKFSNQEIELIKRSQDYKEKIQSIQNANVELQRFAIVISHDLKSPIRTIESFLRLLQKRMPQLSGQDSLEMEYLSFAIDGVKRMSLLINDLLTFSRIGVDGIDMTKYDLNVIMKDVLKNIALMITESNAQIEYNNLPSIFVNKVHMLQLFQNLISNSIRFKKENQEPIIKITSTSEGEFIKISIEDNGIGIPKQYSQHVFNVFQRLSKNTNIEGTGIGLAVCKKIVKIYQGEIWIDENYNNGTKFVFTLKKTITNKNLQSSNLIH